MQVCRASAMRVSSARGLDHLLVPGLGKEAHVAASAELPTPFYPRDWPEPDIGFVVEALYVWQKCLPRMRPNSGMC